MSYSINGFWSRRLGEGAAPPLKHRKGWYAGGDLIDGFVEPPLGPGPSREFGETRIEDACVILIAAPGAVGKTTFTKQISALTGAIRVDLSETGAIGDNFLSGGLHKVGAYEGYHDGRIGVLIDGLDEALLKTSTEGLADFLKDVLEVASGHSRPIVIADRSGSINEAWLILTEQNYTEPVVQIEYFDEIQAENAAIGMLKRLLLKGPNERPMVQADKEAIALLLSGLRCATAADEFSFAGYAPVLEAIAKQVAAYRNPQELVGRLKKEYTADVRGVVKDILVREQKKIYQLNLSDTSLHGRLYTPDEQTARLVQRLFGAETRVSLPAMSDEDRATYETNLQKWFGEHPFLDGFGRGPSSAVFGGYLAAEALRRPESARETRDALSKRGALPNPFLSTFYLPDDWEGPEAFQFQNLADLPIIHASLLARIPVSDRIMLDIDGVEDDIEVDVQMTWKSRAFETDRVLSGRVEATSALVFGGRIADVRVDAEGLDVEIGNGVDAVLFAPVEISARALMLDASSLTVEPYRALRLMNEAASAEVESTKHDDVPRARLIASTPIVTSKPPSIRVVAGSGLTVTWPGSKAYPWTDYATAATQPPPPELNEAYGRMRKIVLPFKSDKYGTLAKYKKFVDHNRRTKGSGLKVRDHLLRNGVIRSQDHRFYQLDPARLTEVTGLTRDQIRNGEVAERTVEFLREALSQD